MLAVILKYFAFLGRRTLRHLHENKISKSRNIIHIWRILFDTIHTIVKLKILKESSHPNLAMNIDHIKHLEYWPNHYVLPPTYRQAWVVALYSPKTFVLNLEVS